MSRSIAGHTLIAEGAPHDDQGRRVGDSTGGTGHARCECGATSPTYTSRTARQTWHRDHKNAIRPTAPGVFDPTRTYSDDYAPRSRAEAERLGKLAEKKLIPLASTLAFAVRHEDRHSIERHLHGLDEQARLGLIVTLAAMVDLDRTEAELLSWINFDEFEQPLTPEQHIGNQNYARLEAALKEAAA